MNPPKPARGRAVHRVRRAARAKVNLYLHVLGKRADAYHDLDSLVVFAEFGDEIEAASAPDLSLQVIGPFADQVPQSTGNLVLRAAGRLRAAARTGAGAGITLTKRLPVAAGLGGGSADAAAALHALCELWEIEPTRVDLRKIAAALGADVPVCLAGRASLIRGRGEDIVPAPALPPCHFVLANPGVALGTAEVFARHDGAGSGKAPLEGPFPDACALARALSERRNDLEPAARALAPAIGETLRLIAETPGCLLARMSGSGATCFGLFENSIDAEAAAGIVRRSEPDWWIEATAMNDA
ncbi:MAG: 4-(cytidine 5'-diphospho)-2-C-methyl-D-erythritol kinase [Proteobacteria bacterium]|nr:4-(cytidine 5'-diphospho)-2-C-methyl-D-erythritol kinase [Pseudomonadota bacterium]